MIKEILEALNEAIKTHPDIKEYAKILKAKGFKTKISGGQLNVSFDKGVTEKEAAEMFQKALPSKWVQDKNFDKVDIKLTSVDVKAIFREYSGKVIAQVMEIT